MHHLKTICIVLCIIKIDRGIDINSAVCEQLDLEAALCHQSRIIDKIKSDLIGILYLEIIVPIGGLDLTPCRFHILGIIHLHGQCLILPAPVQTVLPLIVPYAVIIPVIDILIKTPACKDILLYGLIRFLLCSILKSHIAIIDRASIVTHPACKLYCEFCQIILCYFITKGK